MSRPSRLGLVLAFAAVYLIWGSTYLATRFGVAAIPPFLLAGVRFILGGAAFTAWAWTHGAERPTARDWATTAGIGALMAAGGNGLVSWALQTVQSGLGALLVALVPLWVVLIDWLRPSGRRPPQRVTLGLLLGFSGVALLIAPSAVGARQIDLAGAGTIIVASFLWASGSVCSRHAQQPRSQALSSGMQMLGGGGVLLGLSAMAGEFRQMDWRGAHWRLGRLGLPHGVWFHRLRKLSLAAQGVDPREGRNLCLCQSCDRTAARVPARRRNALDLDDGMLRRRGDRGVACGVQIVTVIGVDVSRRPCHLARLRHKRGRRSDSPRASGADESMYILSGD